MKRIFLIVVVLSFLFCVSPAQAREKEVVMWLVGSEEQALTINKIGEEFSKKTGVKVRCEAISWGEAHSKYLTSVVGGVAPDIGTMGLTWGTEFGNLGAMIDLEKEFPRDLEEIKRQTFPTIWKAVEYKGAAYAIPFDISLHIIYYRTDLIPQSPRTWQELTQLLEKLDKQNKAMVIDWGHLSWLGFAPFLWQAGGDFYDQNGIESTLDSEKASQALKFFTDLYVKYHVPITPVPVEQSLRSGDHPICISGNWKINSLEHVAPELKGKWSIASLPAGPSSKRTAFIGGRVMGIFAQSKLKKESWEFVKFLSERDTQVALFQAAAETFDTYLPPNLEAWEKLEMKPGFKETLKSQILDAQGPPSVLGWDDSTRFIDTAIQEVVLKKKNPATVLKQAKKELDKRIKK